MKIIQSFSIEHATRHNNTLIFPVIHPTLCDRYFGFECEPEDRVIVATYSPLEEQFKVYTGQEWIPVPVAEFQPAPFVRAGISQWYGPIQFQVQFTDFPSMGTLPGTNRVQSDDTMQFVSDFPGSYWQRVPFKFDWLKIGYEVSTDLRSYLFKTALPQLLSNPLRFHRMGVINNADPHICVFNTNGLPLEQATNFEVQPFDSYRVPGVLVGNEVQSRQPFPKTGGCRVFYTLPVPVECLDTDFLQIKSVPCIVLRSLPEGKTHKPLRYEGILASNPFREELDVINYGYEQPIEISAIAATDEDAHILGNHIFTVIKNTGHLYSPPHDLKIPVSIRQGLKRGLTGGDILGILPSYKLEILLYLTISE